MAGVKRKMVELEANIGCNGSSRLNFRKSFDKEDEFMTFFSKSASMQARSLSNFSSHSVKIDYSFVGNDSISVYPTGEHAFHGGKFKILGQLIKDNKSRQTELLNHSELFEGESLNSCSISSAAAAKKAGGKGGIRLSVDEMSQWDQEQICNEKIAHAEIREFLVSTRDVYLVHHERATGWPRYGATVLKPENSPFKDDRRWLKGDNLLGEMWMKAREQLSSTIEK